MNEYDRKGLTSEQVAESRRLHGDNVITPRKGDSAWKLLLDKFRDPIIQVLLIAALLSLAMAFFDGEFMETIGIICAIILATCVGFFFELDAMRRFKRLNQVNEDIPVKVMRDGVVTEVPRRDVVVGDLVFVENGETIPADGKLIEAVSLKINESTLTGEPEVDKTTDERFFEEEATYPSNMLMRGTTVVDGYGKMIVEAVGDHTEAGRVTEQSTMVSDEPTPLNRQLTRLSRLIGKIGIAVSITIFVALLIKAYMSGQLNTSDWVATSHEVLRIFMVSVALIVMAVPEGLPMSITLSLAMSMRRMLKTNNLVRKMHACETMGAVTVICTDKTGTLTQNRMHVEQIVRYSEVDDRLLAEVIAANSTAFLDGAGAPIGNPTEGALLLYLKEQGFDYAALREGAAIVDRMTFTTERKFMATIISSGVNGKRLICVKGAPEIVRKMCLPDGKDAQVNEQLAQFQGSAMRTLGIAYAETTADKCEDALRNPELAFVAVAAIIDPVREDVPAAVARCMNAGIAIKIVTGDTSATAREIARRIGLWNDEKDSARNEITGVEFAAMSDEELLDRVGDLKIMARARPLDKQRLVRLLQQKGEVVAVTGDGTNDAPALNFANVGLSMGTGTSVAKDASDITLLDDSFTSIASAVMWGRSLYRNIQRFVLFQLTINFAAIIVVFFGSLFGTEMPLTVVQILWVNIIMDTFAALAMASLPPNPAVMNEPPRPRDEFIITPAMARTIFTCGAVFVAILLGMLFYWRATTGALTIEQLTIFFSVFVFLQFWNMFNAKGFEACHSVLHDLKGSRTFFLVLLFIAVGQIVIVEWGGAVFRTTPLSLVQWIEVIGYTSLIAILGDIVRTIRRRLHPWSNCRK